MTLFYRVNVWGLTDIQLEDAINHFLWLPQPTQSFWKRFVLLWEKMDDTKGGTRSRISKKDRQYNGQKYKMTYTTQKTKDWATRTSQQIGGELRYLTELFV